MQKRIILIGELIIDRNLFIREVGRSTEFNVQKNILINEKINLGGAGMVYSGLKLLSNQIDFFSITNFNFTKNLQKLLKKNIIFDEKYMLEKNRFWKNKKMIMQINNLVNSKVAVKKFQNNLIKKIEKFNKNDVVILSDYRQGIFEKNFTKKIVRLIKLNGNIIHVDQQSTSRNPDLIKFKNSDFLILNKGEYLKAFKIYKLEKSNFKNSLKILQKKIGIKNLIIKDGKDGSIFLNNNKLFKVKALKTLKNANTIGAGDFFLAKFATSKKTNMIERLFESNKFAYKKISNNIKTKN